MLTNLEGLYDMTRELEGSATREGCAAGLMLVDEAALYAVIHGVKHLKTQGVCDERATTSAKQFMQELLGSVECLSDIAVVYGERTLADLMYLHYAIADCSFIDYFPDESCVLDVVRPLPSGEQWVKYIKVESGDHTADAEKVCAEVGDNDKVPVACATVGADDEAPLGTPGRLVTLDGIEIKGTLETVDGVTGIISAVRNEDGSLSYEHGDQATMWWDEQETAHDANGDVIFVTVDGDEVPASQVKQIEQD